MQICDKEKIYNKITVIPISNLFQQFYTRATFQEIVDCISLPTQIFSQYKLLNYSVNRIINTTVY